MSNPCEKNHFEKNFSDHRRKWWTVKPQEKVSPTRRDILRKKNVHAQVLNRTDVAELQMVHRYSYDKHPRVYRCNYYLINKRGKVVSVTYGAHPHCVISRRTLRGDKNKSECVWMMREKNKSGFFISFNKA